MGGGAGFQGNVGGVSDPGLSGPNYMGNYGTPNVAAPNPFGLGGVGAMAGNQPVQPNQGPSMWNRFQTNAGKYARALQPLVNALPGSPAQQQQQQQQQRQQAPVNFNIPQQPYIPPPQAINPFTNTNFGQF